jgi:predicted metal-binding membrane protein
MTPIQLTRHHPAIAAALLATAAAAWWWTVERMAGMDAAPGTSLGTLGWFTTTWVVMMAAMMLPSFAPTLAAYATVTPARRPARPVLFACGYLLAWTAAGVVAYELFALGRQLLGGELAWHDGGRWLSAAVIAAAAAYQFSPLKHASLARCRGELATPPAGEGRRQPAALELGMRSGGWCIGCSWALMAALFALGAMSLTWMGLIAAMVAAEKSVRRPRVARLTTAVVLAALAVGILVAPGDVPGLVLPGSSGAMHMTMTQ